MKKYATISSIIISTLFFSTMSRADYTGQQDLKDDIVYGHEVTRASEGKKYVQSESRSNELGDDLLTYREDFTHSSLEDRSALAGGHNHDDDSDLLHLTGG